MLGACGWFGSDESAEVAALQKELAALRAEVTAMREEVDVAHDVVAAPAPHRSAAQRADFDELAGDVVRNAELADAVDLDLEALEQDLDGLRSKVAVMEVQLSAIEGIVNNHADVMDELSTDLGAMEAETDALRPLNDLLYFDDGKIFVDGVDMVFRPAKNPDGTDRSTGPVMVRPPIE